MFNENDDYKLMRNIIIIVIFLIFRTGFSQYVTVKDINFGKAVCQTYPAIMDANCTMLDTAAAENIDYSLIIKNANIVDASDIVYFNRMDTLIISGNNLSTLIPNIYASNFWSLHYLDISNNQIVNFPILNVNTNYRLITDIYFQNNKATDFQKLWSARDSIRVLNISSNFISDCEDYSKALKATKIDLSNNYFTFEDLIKQTANPQFSTVFTVSPQRSIRWGASSFTAQEIKKYDLVLPVDNSVTSNTYKWFRDGQLVATTTKNTLSFDTVRLSDAGTYVVEITNSTPLLNGIVLKSEAVELEVEACMELTKPPFIVEEKCNGVILSVVEGVKLNSESPFVFYLKSDESGVVELKQGDAVELRIGEYQVSVTDAIGCKKKCEQNLILNSFSGCDEHVITPNGDGLQDEYYFDQNGRAEIFDQYGFKVKTLRLPTFWDAKNESGEIVPPGKYVLVLNGKEKMVLKIVW